MSTLAVVALEPHHAASVHAIHAEGLATGIAAFRSSPPLWKEWDAAHLPVGRAVAVLDGRVVGWAALTQAADT